MKRHGLSVRCVTSVGQPLPGDWQEKFASFQLFIKDRKIGVDLKHLGNMDEVPVSFDIPDSRTVHAKGAEDIQLITTGNEKCNFTGILSVTADGHKCEPMVIFKRKTMPKEKFPEGIIVTVNKKAWVDQEIMKQWLEKVWRRRPGAFFKPKSLFIYDSARAHLTEEVKKEVKKMSDLAVIPGGLTKKLQPLDLSVNKSFKSKMRNYWETWMVDGCHTYTKTGRMKRASYSEICELIVKSWAAVTPQCVKNGFRKAEIHSYDELEEEDRNTEIETETDEEEVDLPVIPEQLLDIFESFEMIDNEDFDGFDEIE
jgi:hypothetical protein